LQPRYDVHFADADPQARPPSIAPGAWHAVPLASAPDFMERLLDLCGGLGVDLLVPGVDEELTTIAAGRQALSCAVLLPEAGFVATHLDKLASCAALRGSGVPTPLTELCPDRRDVAFPCIVKPRRGRGSRDVRAVASEEELRAHILLCRRPAGDFIVQQQLRGQEYTVTMVADRHGVLRAVVPVRVAVKRGITLRAETDRDRRVVDACVAIHRAQPASGCFNIQAIKTDDGAVMPFEINPRISTTACLALAAGVDFVGLYLGGDAAAPSAALAPFQDGLRLARSWHNEFTAEAG
jgi:carbamoyl-phosphate synthase large subunit